MVVAPGDDRVGPELGVQLGQLQRLGAAPGHAAVAHIEKVVFRADLVGHPRAVFAADAGHVLVGGVPELAGEFAQRGPDQHDLVAARRVLGQGTDTADFVIGVGKDSHDSHTVSIAAPGHTAPMSSRAHEHLSALALDLGADVVGWASAAVPAGAVDEYAAWLAAGRHAGMAYLERQLPARADPGSRLEGARGVLVLGVSHAFGPPPRPAGGIRVGRVARYAWTPDYHDQLQPVLTRLEQEATALGVRSRGYVDHGPVMERLFASGAFLGWRGKSGMMVSPSLGAFVTLAVLLTDLEVEPPPAHPDRCGRCARCVLACPTAAIGPDRAIDARRCISYLTIEHRGPHPLEHRRAVGEWLFGCDICSEVCPWSQKAGPLARLLRPDPELAAPDLSGFFGVGEREFERRFAGTAFLRPRRKGMARNALTVLGNTRAPEGWPLLLAGAQDPAWEVREAAAWALARWDEPAALRGLLDDPHGAVRERVQAGLEETAV